LTAVRSVSRYPANSPTNWGNEGESITGILNPLIRVQKYCALFKSGCAQKAKAAANLQ
jgi:hypothetical protein